MPEFLTIPDELLHVAEAAYQHFDGRGYEVGIEQKKLGYPAVPAMVACGQHESIIVEVASGLDRHRLKRWLGYCRSQSSDTQLSVFTPEQDAIPPADFQYVLENRLGYCTVGNGGVMEINQSADLAVNVELPPLAEQKPAVRRKLGSAYRKFERGDWRDGLDDACQAVESLAREHLKALNAAGQLQVIDQNGRVENLTPEVIDKLTLGQLGHKYQRIRNMKKTETIFANAIPLINPQRVGLAHNRENPQVEEALRRSVGGHMYAIIDCLDELL